MQATRARAAKPPTTSKATSVKASETTPAPLDLFPFAQYASVLGVYLILVGFTTLYLPQTTRLFAPLAARKTDRPQSEFMETLTGDPSSTLCWISAGLTLLQVWWASWVRKWSFEQTAKGTELEIKLDRVRFDSLYFTVRRYKLLGRPHSLIRSLCLEIQGRDCVHHVCCLDNTRCRRHVWCPARNVSLFVLNFWLFSLRHGGVISCKQHS